MGRAARLGRKPHAETSQGRRQRGIAIANSFAVYDKAKGDCGLLKWCYNAMRLVQMPWLAGQAEVVAWTNARGAEFARAECGPRVQRIVEFDADLQDVARRWAVATADACKSRGSRCHLGQRSVNDVALLKWQLVRHEEYQLIFLTDTDVDVFDSHYARSEAEYLLYLQRAWETGLHALLGPSAITGQVKAPTRYPNRTQLVANPDFESPLNAGVMLFVPSASAYRRGVQAPDPCPDPVSDPNADPNPNPNPNGNPNPNPNPNGNGNPNQGVLMGVLGAGFVQATASLVLLVRLGLGLGLGLGLAYPNPNPKQLR